MSELPTTKEALIWKLMIAIAEAEGKSSGISFGNMGADRAYISELFSYVKETVDGPRRKGPTEAMGDARRATPGTAGASGWMGS